MRVAVAKFLVATLRDGDDEVYRISTDGEQVDETDLGVCVVS